MRSLKKVWYQCLFAVFVALSARAALAQGTNTISPTTTANPLDKLNSVGRNAGYGDATSSSLMDIVGTVINVLLGTLGTIFIILIIVAGFNWMTAGGNEEQVKKAGDMIRRAIIGLIVIVGAFAIWTFISRVLIDDTGSGSLTPPS